MEARLKAPPVMSIQAWAREPNEQAILGKTCRHTYSVPKPFFIIKKLLTFSIIYFFYVYMNFYVFVYIYKISI